MEEYLTQEGFSKASTKDANYADCPGIKKIYRQHFPMESVYIDVHLVANPDKKNEAQAILKDKNLITPMMEKHQRKQVWLVAEALLETQLIASK